MWRCILYIRLRCSGDGYVCLPEYGCHNDLHCIANFSHCDVSKSLCLCHDDSLPSDDTVCHVRPPTPRLDRARADPMWIVIMIVCFSLVFLAIVVIATICILS